MNYINLIDWLSDFYLYDIICFDNGWQFFLRMLETKTPIINWGNHINLNFELNAHSSDVFFSEKWFNFKRLALSISHHVAMTTNHIIWRWINMTMCLSFLNVIITYSGYETSSKYEGGVIVWRFLKTIKILYCQCRIFTPPHLAFFISLTASHFMNMVILNIDWRITQQFIEYQFSWNGSIITRLPSYFYQKNNRKFVNWTSKAMSSNSVQYERQIQLKTKNTLQWNTYYWIRLVDL